MRILTHSLLLDLYLVRGIIVGCIAFAGRSDGGSLVHSPSGDDQEQGQCGHDGQGGDYGNHHQGTVVVAYGLVCARS